jgi:hypothetical protein
MGWIGTEDEDVYAPPERVDPFPFSAEGRLYQRIEHELSLSEAVLKVGALVLEKSAIQSKLRRARQRHRRRVGPSETHPVR